VIGIAQDNLRTQLFQDVLRHALDGSQRADRHEHWGFNGTVGGDQAAKAGWASGLVNLQLR